jgi:hypothetical protein
MLNTYFDRILSEALDDKRVEKIQDLFKAIAKARKNKEDTEELEKQLNQFRRYPDDCREAIERFDKDNRNREGYDEHLEMLAKRNIKGPDNLMTWMLRHLVSRAERGGA